jgi:hypothetical protein
MRLGKTLSFAVAMLASGTAFAGTPGWSISESSGQVSVVSTGLVKAAVRGGAVATGDIINTGRNGRAVLVRGEEYLVVSPNTRIRVADPAKSGGLTQIVEHFGNVIYKIKKMTMPHFAVETPFLAAVVKGTTFSVTVTEKGAAVQVTEGRVEVATRDGGASFMVLPGDIGSVSANAPATLNVQGRENRSISSPTPAAAVAAVTASVEAEAPVASPAAPEAPAEQAQFSGSIDKPVTEGAVNLSAMSDGMVSGDSSMTAMAAMSSTGNQTVRSEAAAPAAPAVVDIAVTPAPVAVGGATPVGGASPILTGVVADPVPVDTAPVVTVVDPAPAGPAIIDPPVVVTVDPAPVVPPPPAPPIIVGPSSLPPAPAPDPVEALPPVGGVIDPVPVSLPPTPAPVDDPVPAPLPPTPAPAVDPAPTPLPPAPAIDPAPTPLPPAPIVTVADPTPAGPAIVEPVQVVTAAPTAPAPSPTVTPAPAPALSPLPAPAPTAPVTNSGTSTNWNGGNNGPGNNWNGGNQNDQGQNDN